jgi:hypothetical protein
VYLLYFGRGGTAELAGGGWRQSGRLIQSAGTAIPSRGAGETKQQA